MSVPHPIPYQGSKRYLADFILRFFPEDAPRLLEPFAGSAAVSLAARYREKAKTVILNDRNEPLMDLWKMIVHEPQTIASQYKELWEEQLGRERTYYDLIRERFNKTRQPRFLLYLLARCVKASVRYNANGAFNQSPDNRRKGAHPQRMQEHILGASGLLKGRTQLLCCDYQDVLDAARRRDVVYMDPPYQGVCNNRDPRYLQSVSFERFVEALSGLVNRNISFVLSYDGRSGTKRYGRPLPPDLKLTRLEVNAGRSSQATLLGKSHNTYESIYLSPALLPRLKTREVQDVLKPKKQLSFFEIR